MTTNFETLVLFYREREESTQMRMSFPVKRFDAAKQEYEKLKQKKILLCGTCYFG
ncbi:hypothetical protein OCE52_24330 [Bacillus mobilis]|uniref:hypothetical protein n=1 Tax=Bacillus mobilis TaxID=2026190 RepID=UPI0021CE2FD6|nr:hypothetical protein [Bacillus mobilis]MCU5197927.1 hypothetical protein [Bacillus mobilis]